MYHLFPRFRLTQYIELLFHHLFENPVLFHDALLAKYFGLEADDTSNVSSSSVLVSSKIANLQRYDYVNIHSSIADNSGNSIIAQIPTGSIGYLGIIEYFPSDPNRMSVGLNENRVNNGQFHLCDGSGRTIDMNGVDWNVVINFYNDGNNLND